MIPISTISCRDPQSLHITSNHSPHVFRHARNSVDCSFRLGSHAAKISLPTAFNLSLAVRRHPPVTARIASLIFALATLAIVPSFSDRVVAHSAQAFVAIPLYVPRVPSAVISDAMMRRFGNLENGKRSASSGRMVVLAVDELGQPNLVAQPAVSVVFPGAEKVSYAEVAKQKSRTATETKRSGRSRPTKACLAMRQTRPILSISPPGQRPPKSPLMPTRFQSGRNT
jgi:hypothetical protein